MRLIDADALKEEAIEGLEKYWPYGGMTEFTAVSVDDIDNAPTIDAAPVVHAMWNKNGLCTNCGNEAEYTEWVEDLVGYDWDFNTRKFGEELHRDHKLTNYCPNCGAKMDGDQHDSC